MPYLKTGERWRPIGLTLILSLALTVGLMPTAKLIGQWIPIGIADPYLVRLKDLVGFPLVAFFFFLSFPGQMRPLPPRMVINLWRTLALPLLIALIFGWIHPGPPLYRFFEDGDRRFLIWATWNLVFIPLGEEWLFRGWLYNLIDRMWLGKFFTATNPLPVAVWMSAIAFSLWHSQNFGHEPAPFVLFQMAYTFFTGLWLGVLRWQTGSILPPLGAHIALNLAASII